MGVSKNRGTPKSSILIGFSIINHPFSGTPIFVFSHIEQGLVLCYGSFLRDDSLLRESWPNGWWRWGKCYFCQKDVWCVRPCTMHLSGQIIATSHDLGPQKVAKEGKWDPFFQGNLGWWNIIIGQIYACTLHLASEALLHGTWRTPRASYSFIIRKASPEPSAVHAVLQSPCCPSRLTQVYCPYPDIQCMFFFVYIYFLNYSNVGK